MNEKQTIIEAIASAFKDTEGEYLSYRQFKASSGISMSKIYRHFDSWAEACRTAGATPGEASPSNITPNYSKGKEHALNELKKIAHNLGTSVVTMKMFDEQNPEILASTVSRLWGGWRNAIEAAGLSPHPNYRKAIPLAELAQEFLDVVNEIGRIPAVHQIVRRSNHGMNTFTRKFGGYIQFKISAIEYLLDQVDINEDIQCTLRDHLKQLNPPTENIPPPAVHRKGRHLGFRAFAFAPTNESDVVAMFGAVANELGFEIVSTRGPFPDCEARRKTKTRRPTFRKCLIEFEFQSSDFRKHRHPQDGCDLIVCWEHDWEECPLEVLELSSEINKLDGWK